MSHFTDGTQVSVQMRSFLWAPLARVTPTPFLAGLLFLQVNCWVAVPGVSLRVRGLRMQAVLRAETGGPGFHVLRQSSSSQ